jgi:hypothetical protein
LNEHVDVHQGICDCFAGMPLVVAVAEGEITYPCGRSVLTRHFMWRLAKLALVYTDSRNIFLISEIPGVAGASGAERMRSAMEEGLHNLFGCDCQSFTLHDQCTSIVWE